MTMFFDELIVRTFESDPRVDAIYLLGSVTNGYLRTDSDIDIAILPAIGAKFDSICRHASASSLSLELGRDIDIGLLSSDNLVYTYQAIMTGRRLFARNPGDADQRLACLLGMYGQFNLDRTEVCNAYST
jgi:predicted nucleotidyltransferase